jgi:predicted RNA-binding Zn-ribbon protein involved in translation (DUF1610 family)
VHPVATPTFECVACGATYVLDPQTLSVTCPHCGSAFVIDHSASKDLIPPQGVVPFSLEQEAAIQSLRQWLTDAGVQPVESIGQARGIYLPAWTFDLTGEAPYHYERYDGNDWVPETGSQIILYNNLPVAGSHTLPPAFRDCYFGFDLTDLVEFQPSKLAGWPAETYQIPATDAAMAARWYVVEQARQKAQRGLYGRIRDFHLRSTDLLVASYRLILLPFWLSGYAAGGAPYRAIINGQTGEVRADQPQRGMLASIKHMLGW